MPILGLQPGLHPDISDTDYHADNLCSVPTLSCSLAKTLISESPLHGFYAHPRLGLKAGEGDESSKAMDYGSLGHALILGKGAEVEIGQWDDWKKKEAREFRDAAREAGKIPVLQCVYDRAEQMKDAALEGIDRLGYGERFDRAMKEVVLLWKDGEIMLRAKLDALDRQPDFATIFDLKITERAHPDIIARQIGPMNYDLQNIWYESGVPALFPELAGRTKFVYFFVESEFPFSVVEINLSGEFRALGEMKFKRAKTIWSMGCKTGVWPGYAQHPLTIFPKPWELAHEMEQVIPSFEGGAPTTEPPVTAPAVAEAEPPFA